MGPVLRRHARTGDPRTAVRVIPLEGWGPHTGPRPTLIRGAGPDHPWDAATKEWLQATPGPQAGSTRDVSSLIRAPIPPRVVLHTGNVLRATEIHTWGRNAATIWWLPVEDGAARLAVVHLQTRGPVYDNALSRLGDTLGPLLLMLPTNLAAALRQELGCWAGLWLGWEAVADGGLLALLHRDAAGEYWTGTLAPHLTGRHIYMANPPQGHRPAWDDLIAAFQHHRVLPDDTWQKVRQKTLSKDYRRPRLPAGAPRPPPPEVGRPLAPPSRPLVTAVPPTRNLRGMQYGVLRSVNGRQQVHTVLPGGRVPLARTPRGPAQVHGRGGLAPAHRGSTRPLARMRGPRGRRPPVDPRASAGPNVRCEPVARVRALTHPDAAALYRARSIMLR